MKNIHTFESFLNEGNISMYKSTVQAALKQLGYDVKQSDLKIGTKKESNYDLITLNGELLCSSSDYAQMVTWIQNAVKEDPKKYDLDPRVLESVNEGDMTKDYDGFIVLDFKTKKLYKGHYIKGVKNTKAEDTAIDKAMKMTGSPRSNFAVHGFIKKGEWDSSDTEILEAINTKYWADYNTDTSGQGNKEFAEKSKDFDDTFSLAVSDWNDEADGAENRIKGSQIDKIKKLAQEFFKKEGYISVNIAQAMIAQEGH
jgi:galactitol-specific phosphotransferase system IIB component